MNELWLLAMGAAIAGLVQGISGFAFAMVAMSIWVWGIDPLIAAPMAVFGGWFGQVISAFRVRRGWYVSILWPFVVGNTVLGVVAGVVGYAALKDILERRHAMKARSGISVPEA